MIIKVFPIVIQFIIDIWREFREADVMRLTQLDEARVQLDKAAEHVRNMQVGPPPPRVNPLPQSGGAWIDNDAIDLSRIQVPNDGWLPEKVIHIFSVGRAVKLPKKDE